jgi:hypothetical protein
MRVLFKTLISAAAALSLLAPVAASAQEQMPAGSDEQRAAMDALSFMDGEWRGQATSFGPRGVRTDLIQTERVGPFLGGSVRVVEGRGYDAAGATAFNALGVISWNDAEDRYEFSAWANGRQGSYRFERTDTGFTWEVPAGPGAVIRYVATIQDGVWHEVGDYVREGGQPLRFIEMTLHRIGDSDWPGEGSVSPR